MKRLAYLAALVIFASTFAACRSSLTSPTNTAPYSQTDLRVGTGATAGVGNTLAVQYTGWLYDASAPDQKGAQFDSSAGTPFLFVLGSGQVIAGWDRGVTGMQTGGLRRLIVPPSLAYGGARRGIIPPNATLVFDIELVSVQ